MKTLSSSSSKPKIMDSHLLGYHASRCVIYMTYFLSRVNPHISSSTKCVFYICTTSSTYAHCTRVTRPRSKRDRLIVIDHVVLSYARRCFLFKYVSLCYILSVWIFLKVFKILEYFSLYFFNEYIFYALKIHKAT